jgi:NAD(P)-dependent dehydrogenase (short-subunit alcohol dehydrogenase family)
MNLFDLTGEVAVVLGATGVLGGAMAEGLATAGATVAVLGRNADRGEARVRAIQKQGGTAEFFPADALDQSSLTAAREALRSRFGAPGILVNAAGGNEPRVTVTAEHPFEAIGVTDWRANFDLNLVGGALLPCQVFGPAMKEQRRQHPQRRQRFRPLAPLGRRGLFSRQGGAAKPHPVSRAGMGALPRPR